MTSSSSCVSTSRSESGYPTQRRAYPWKHQICDLKDKPNSMSKAIMHVYSWHIHTSKFELCGLKAYHISDCALFRSIQNRDNIQVKFNIANLFFQLGRNAKSSWLVNLSRFDTNSTCSTTTWQSKTNLFLPRILKHKSTILPKSNTKIFRVP
jgi:hypothetical protein